MIVAAMIMLHAAKLPFRWKSRKGRLIVTMDNAANIGRAMALIGLAGVPICCIGAVGDGDVELSMTFYIKRILPSSDIFLRMKTV